MFMMFIERGQVFKQMPFYVTGMVQYCNMMEQYRIIGIRSVIMTNGFRFG